MRQCSHAGCHDFFSDARRALSLKTRTSLHSDYRFDVICDFEERVFVYVRRCITIPKYQGQLYLSSPAQERW